MTASARLALIAAVMGATVALPAQTSTQLPIPRGPNVLLGRVVDMSADTPIGGAIVTIFGFVDSAGKPLPGIPQGLIGQSESRNTMTTADGHFVFRDLAAGHYTVAVRAIGYSNVDAWQAIEIHDNDKPRPIPVRLWKYASISGRVIDERGEPVVGMHVNALRRSASASGVVMNRAGLGITDDRGSYRISQLMPGDYLVGVMSTTTTMPVSVAGAMESSAANRDAYMEMSNTLRQSGPFRTWGCAECWASSSDGERYGNLVLQRLGPTLPLTPDGKPLAFANSLYPGTSSLTDATVVTVGSGESRAAVDIPIRFVRAVSVSGVVTGPDGPMKSLFVRLAPPGIGLNDLDPAGIATAVTDTQGAFTILGTTPGEYVLSAAFSDVNERTREGRVLSAVQQLAVGDTDIAGLTLTMQPGARVLGRVEFSNPASSGRPTMPLIVSISPVRSLSARQSSTTMQPDGAFRSGGHPPGQYTISALPAGTESGAHRAWFWQSTTLAGRPLVDEVIEIGSSELTGLVITFGLTTNRVSGAVTDANGAPDAGAAVIAFAAEPTAAWRKGILTSRRIRRVNSTSKGNYEIATLAPGEYFLAAVSVRQALDWRTPQFLERLINGATRVTIGVDDSKNVPLKTIVPGGR